MKNRPFFLIIIISFFLFACQKETISEGQISDSLWLENKGAQMPILVEGNIASKTLLLILHGGPGGTAKSYNDDSTEMSEPLEERYAVAYYDQRLAGNTKGHYDVSTVTVAQMVEDLDLVVELLRNQYGADLQIFLLGHSWGGYLGNAYLATANYQSKISGWIDVAGAHDIQKLTLDGVTLMQEVSEQQISTNSSQQKEWKKVMEYVNDFNQQKENNTLVLDKETVLEMNGEAGTALDLVAKDKLTAPTELTRKEILASLFSDNNQLTSASNEKQNLKSTLWEEIIPNSLSDQLPKIATPSLLIWGKYDFVVAPSLGEEMMQKLGTPAADKSLHIFDQSGHSPMLTEPEKFVDLVIQFVEQYR